MTEQWWRDAVVYQVYVRSFADGNGDGTGDVAGLRSRLDYLASLGVDALWVNPWYPSPLKDGGYDVADYRDIDPQFGTMAEAEALITDAHARGLRVLLDLVPNHTSSEHVWFQQALAAGPGSDERARYWFRPGRGEDGSQPPNDWRSVFGGPAWTRITEPDGSPGEWYLHLFDSSQPDLHWENPEVVEEFEDVLRFWFDRGADGFRIDVCQGLSKDPALPDLSRDASAQADAILGPPEHTGHPHWDREESHDVFRGWRAVADAYDPPRMFVGEVWLADPRRLAHYLRPDELHTAFAFDFVRPSWDAAQFRTSIDAALDSAGSVGAPVTWVLSNHDILRHVTRFGSDITGPNLGDPDSSVEDADPVHGHPGNVDVALGRRRARAALLLMLALPGSVYLYQGEELGLEEVLDLPDEVRDDPVWHRTNGAAIGRDGCRVPIPWAREGNSFGFGDDGSWLPQPASWGDVSVAAQEGDPDSMLALYRAALKTRRAQAALGDGDLRWEEAAEGVLRFRREPGLTCVVNLTAAEVALPPGEVVLASAPVPGGRLPADAAAWVLDD